MNCSKLFSLIILQCLSYKVLSQSYYVRPYPCYVNTLWYHGIYNQDFHKYVGVDKTCCTNPQNRESCCVMTETTGAKTCRCDPALKCTSGGSTTGGGGTKQYCPVLTARVLNSEPVSDVCGNFQGVLSITQVMGTVKISFCNAIFTTINGDNDLKLVSTFLCVETIRETLKRKGVVVIQSDNGEEIPITFFTMKDGPNGLGFLTYNAVVYIKLRQKCKKHACSLKPEMNGKIDYSNCNVISNGVSDMTDFAQGEQRSISVTFNPFGCQGVQTFGATNTLCFTSNDGKPSICAGDMGAALFCQTKDTKEDVVVGIVVGSNKCGATPDFWVIRFPQ